MKFVIKLKGGSTVMEVKNTNCSELIDKVEKDADAYFEPAEEGTHDVIYRDNKVGNIYLPDIGLDDMYEIIEKMDAGSDIKKPLKMKLGLRKKTMEVEVLDCGDKTWDMVHFVSKVNIRDDVYFRKNNGPTVFDIVGPNGVILKVDLKGDVPKDPYLAELLGLEDETD